MDYGWFARELEARTEHCEFSPLITTCTDGDNGGWFRNATEGSNFWSGFYTELLEAARASKEAVQPVFIHEYIQRHGVHGEVKVATGAWNTGWHNGIDFIQWTGSQQQKDALSELNKASQAIHEAQSQAGQQDADEERDQMLENAMWHLLRAETSCNFYWGEAWVDRCHQDLEIAWQTLRDCQAK